MGLPTYHGGKYTVSANMLHEIKEYVHKGIIPCSFLRRVICNNLMGAVTFALTDQLANLPAYVLYMHNEAPSSCWGSVDKMEQWIAKFKNQA